MWFPIKTMPKFEAAAPVWEIIRRDNRFCYVAVVAEKEPSEMPVPRVHLGSKPRHELEARLDDVELAIEDAQAERAYLTRWHDLLSRDLNRLEDRAVRQECSGRKSIVTIELLPCRVGRPMTACRHSKIIRKNRNSTLHRKHPLKKITRLHSCAIRPGSVPARIWLPFT